MDDLDFSALANPEETFFQHGYSDGYAHGRLHGLIEGRAAGMEKGLELWEEVGYYRGFATLWKYAQENQMNDESASRSKYHINALLAAIDRFPLINPKSIPGNEDELDITKLLSQIRSRYKALCSTLGVKPRLRAVASGDERTEDNDVSANAIWSLDRVALDPQPLEL